jgi:glutathione synthase/RimK-type ligase-like ATP-grasp enzyme
MRHQIAVFTLKDELHGLVVQAALRKRGATCHRVATNDLLASGGLSWSGAGSARVRSADGVWFDVAALDAIWWRRVNQQQLPQLGVARAEHLRLATAEWRNALHGALDCDFHGTWINDPAADRRADHKIVQLAAAASVGLRVPPTYIGQDPVVLRDFCAAHALERMVIKKVQGTIEMALLTVPITPKDLHDDASIRLCPAIYQAEVPGRRHIRAHVFGDRVIAALIESDALDWRPDLNVPMRRFALEPLHARRLVALNRALGLEMSIVDAKLDDDGDLIWLEANPQGAFLFVEALADMDLTGAFCDFLLERAVADRGASRRAAPSADPRASPCARAASSPARPRRRAARARRGT